MPTLCRYITSSSWIILLMPRIGKKSIYGFWKRCESKSLSLPFMMKVMGLIFCDWHLQGYDILVLVSFCGFLGLAELTKVTSNVLCGVSSEPTSWLSLPIASGNLRETQDTWFYNGLPEILVESCMHPLCLHPLWVMKSVWCNDSLSQPFWHHEVGGPNCEWLSWGYDWTYSCHVTFGFAGTDRMVNLPSVIVEFCLKSLRYVLEWL
jgi:hypothetical protein